MDTGTWERIRDLFLDALERDAAARDAWLAAACAGDDAVLAEVRAMLRAHEGDGLALEGALAGAMAAAGDGAAGGGTDAAGPRAGDRMGPWTLIRHLGTGGMGEVWLAERAGEFEQRAAVKLVRPGWRAAQLVTRFRRERQILARLTHPNIATLLDGGVTTDGRPWLAMEYVPGEPVTDWCAARALPLRDRVALFREITDAVAFAHANLVIHRDLKPANILVTEDARPILLDFGIAKLLDDDGEDDGSTRPEERLLTPERAAPEQLRGDPVSTATDVWALGALLYELLAGAPPFPAGGAAGREEAPPPPSRRSADGAALRGDLDAIVLAALRPEPERRYPTAQALAADLERWARGEPVEAVPDSLAYRARKFVRRNRAAVSGAALVALLLLAFAGYAGESARRLGIERDRVGAERDRAERIVSVMVDLFETSDPTVAPGGDTLRVADFLEAAEERLGGLDDEPDVRARLWQTIGRIHAVRSRFDRARDAYAVARDAAREAGADSLVRDLEHETARLTIALDGPRVAEPALRASVARFEREVGPDHPALGTVLQDLAGVVADAEERRSLLDRVLAIQTGAGNATAIASARNALGNLAWEERDYDAAARHFAASLATLEKELPEDHPYRLTLMGNLAMCDQARGDSRSALAAQRALLDARRRILGEEAVGVAGAWSAIGIAQAHLGEAAAACSSFAEAVRILRLRHPEGHPSLLNDRRNLALARVVSGDEGGLAAIDEVAAACGRARGEDSAEAAYLRLQAQRARLLAGRAPTRPVDADVALLLAAEPESHRAGDARLVHAVAALLDGNAAAARDDALALRENRSRTYPAANPACAEAIVLAAAAGADPGPGLDEALRTYAEWGLRIPVLLERARAAAR